MALSKRDQRTLSITVGIVLVFVVWSFGIEPVWESYNDLNDKLESERKKWVENQKTLSAGQSIDEDYARVEAQFPKDDPERDPSEVFNEEVVELVEKTVGTIPDYSPPSTAEIKGATGYEFLMLPLTLRQVQLPKVADLLTEFEKRGFLIQTASITRDSDPDKDNLSLELNLGRIVKIADEEPATLGRPGALRLGGRR